MKSMTLESIIGLLEENIEVVEPRANLETLQATYNTYKAIYGDNTTSQGAYITLLLTAYEAKK